MSDILLLAPGVAGVADRTSPALLTRAASFRFAIALVASMAIFWPSLHRLFDFAGNSEYSYIPIIPAISVFLIVMRRCSIFKDSQPNVGLGSVIVASGILLFSLASFFELVPPASRLSLTTFGIIVTWWGLFVLCYGMQSARKALLPLGLFLFMIPAPASATSAVIGFLQRGTAVLSYSLFRAIGVAAFRDGTTIFLPRLQIEVGPQCSGIRSSISLLIVVLASANLYLRFGWTKILLVATIVPLAILKNAIRIVTLSTLGLYVDPSFLRGHLHHDGGIVFFMIALVMLVPIILIIRRLESWYAVQGMRGQNTLPGPKLPSETPFVQTDSPYDKSCAPFTNSSPNFPQPGPGRN